MYQALYRKYRPRAFSQVAGQEHITETLKSELRSGRISHAYLFTGSRGTGKTTCAKILAKAVNCLSPADGDPCNACENCAGIDDGSVLDILEIDAASNNGVENIRELRENAVFTPAKGKYRVYIIDEVHMLSTGAFNALLKTLEEPPAHVVFILATTEVHKLPATILSRCQRFDFKRIEPEVIAGRLAYVAEQEGLDLTPDAALLVASMADGGMRDALSILDLCAGQEGTIDEQTVERVSGMAGREYLFQLSDALLRRDAAGALTLIGELHNASVDMQRLCEELIGHYRNLMLLKTVPDPKRAVVCTAAELSRLTGQASPVPLETILYSLRLLEDALDRMGRGNRRAELEMAAVRLASPELDTGSDALLERIAALERTVKLLAAGRTAAPPAGTGAGPDLGTAAAAPLPAASLPDESPPPAVTGKAASAVPAAAAAVVDKPPAMTAVDARTAGGQADRPSPAGPDSPAALPDEQRPPWEEAPASYAAPAPPFPDEDLPPPPPDESQLPPVEEPAGPSTTAASSPSPAAHVPSQTGRPAAGQAGAGSDIVCDKWPDILAALAKTCPLMYGVLQGSTAYVRGDLLLIDSKNSQFRTLVKGDNPMYRDEIRKAATEVTGQIYRLGPYRTAEAPAAAADPLDGLLERAGELGLL
ncbi:MAG: DNA polymerase III subunit gamma/tau [Clostridiales bacterium]|nr:DNA polymerase III subunit gamma/tau [Clostridiales bacterium]